MENFDLPPHAGANNPTQPPSYGQPSGAGNQGGGPGRPGRGRRHGAIIRWAAGVGAAAVLVGGGVAAGAALTSSQAPASASLTAATGPAQSANGASLTAFLAGSSGTSANARVRCRSVTRSSTATAQQSAVRRARRVCVRRPGPLARILRRTVHGQFTFRTKNGYRTAAYERGVIQSVSGSSVTVKAPDNTTWTWTLTSSTTVGRRGHKLTTGALRQGEKVIVVGPLANGTYDATHFFLGL